MRRERGDFWNKASRPFDVVIYEAQLHQRDRALEAQLIDGETFAALTHDLGKVAVIDLAGRPLVLAYAGPQRRVWEAVRVERAWSPYLWALDITEHLKRDQLYIANVEATGRLVLSFCGEDQA